MTHDLALSREHFQIENEPPLCHLVDLGSTNGTKVNGLRVTQVALREGDVITAGDSAFVVHFMEDSEGHPAISPPARAAAGGSRSAPPTAKHRPTTRSTCRGGQTERLALRRLPGPPAQVPQDRTPTT